MFVPPKETSSRPPLQDPFLVISLFDALWMAYNNLNQDAQCPVSVFTDPTQLLNNTTFSGCTIVTVRIITGFVFHSNSVPCKPGTAFGVDDCIVIILETKRNRFGEEEGNDLAFIEEEGNDLAKDRCPTVAPDPIS